MIDIDEWGMDPSVRAMRRVFKEMEKSRAELLGRLHISPYDPRIRSWMEKALAAFGRAWGIANQMGVTMDEKKASAVYVHCLARGIGSGGKEIPENILPAGEEIRKLTDEVFK